MRTTLIQPLQSPNPSFRDVFPRKPLFIPSTHHPSPNRNCSPTPSFRTVLCEESAFCQLPAQPVSKAHNHAVPHRYSRPRISFASFLSSLVRWSIIKAHMSDQPIQQLPIRTLSLPDFSLILLIGVSGSGKSTFASEHFL